MPPNQKVQIKNDLDLAYVHQTSAFEWNLSRPPNFISHSTQVPSQIDLDMYDSKAGGKSYSWDFHLAPSASIPSCHLSL